MAIQHWKVAQDQASQATPAVLLARVLALEEKAGTLSESDAAALKAATPPPSPPSTPPTL